MYAVIDAKTVPTLEFKEEAQALLAQLMLDNPEADWHLVGTVVPTDDNALERLYALTHQLLRVSKINPMHLKMELTNIVGDKTEYSALRIMHDARTKIDEGYLK